MKKLLAFCLVLLALTGLSLSLLPSQPAYAGTPAQQKAIDAAKCQEGESSACPTNCPDPASGATSTDPSCGQAEDCTSVDASCNVVARYVNPFVNALAIFAFIAVTIGIVIGGIQYASSGGDPQKAASGKDHVKKAIIALVGLLFLYAFLSFLIPGNLLVRI